MPLKNTRQIRLERRKAAEARQEEYDKLSTKEKLERLPPEPKSKRQRERLLKQLEKETAAHSKKEVDVVVSDSVKKKSKKKVN